MLKVDFKRDPPSPANLAKEIAAIANTDNQSPYNENPNFNDYGFLIIGVENGEIVGYNGWSDWGCPEASEEKLKDCLVQKLKNYIAPLPEMGLYRFEQDSKPFWVILIYPSQQQPHLIIKDGPSVQQFAVYVRKASTVSLASAEDYGRFLSSKPMYTSKPP